MRVQADDWHAKHGENCVVHETGDDSDGELSLTDVLLYARRLM